MAADHTAGDAEDGGQDDAAGVVEHAGRSGDDDGRRHAGDAEGLAAAQDAERAEDIEQAEDTEQTGAAESAAHVEGAEGAGDTGQAEDVVSTQDTEDAAGAQDVEQADDAGSTEAAEDAEAAEQAEGDRVRSFPMPEPVSAALTEALNQLRTAVKGLHFGLDVPGSEEARKAQAAVLAQLDDYVIPRVHMSTAPALVVVAGSTGAGKSTIVNSLAGRKVTATGVRRPTTATPVIVCHPDDHEWYARGDLLGGLNRLDEDTRDAPPGSVVLVSSPFLPPGIALLDTPDIDSVVEEHHEIAHRMLDAADLWVFVTTASRYADAPSWGLLRRAKERGARLVIVLSRVPPKSRDVVVKHFGRMLSEYGLGEVERFVINETSVQDGRLPEIEIADLRVWLSALSVDDERRQAAIKATLNGVLNSFRTRLPALARHLETQVA
ncbi:MAG: dynamin family protein, partial [Microbispora sp.]|nr:dynamin family protein [Microbispora sp.]